MFWRIQLITQQTNAAHFSDALEPHVLAVSWYEKDEKDESIWVVEATTATEPDMALVKTVVSDTAVTIDAPMPDILIEKIPDTDWLEATWKSFPPREIGNFYIYGSHTKTQVPHSFIGLEVNAATAFGSGEHETTTGCLLTLSNLRKNRQINNPLDMGCGSGILAMAITKLWPVCVTAVDNDQESVRVTMENARMNECFDNVCALHSEGFADVAVQNKGPYDLIVANILAKPLCFMAVDMVKNLTSDGVIILSGLLKWQVDEVVEAYRQAGAQLTDERMVNDWATLTLMKA